MTQVLPKRGLCPINHILSTNPFFVHREIAVGQGQLQSTCSPVHLLSEMLTSLINSHNPYFISHFFILALLLCCSVDDSYRPATVITTR